MGKSKAGVDAGFIQGCARKSDAVFLDTDEAFGPLLLGAGVKFLD